MYNKRALILILLISLGFLVRLYKFSEPIADWHSFRQSDTAAVAQIYVNEGYNLLYPKYFDISNVQSGLDNPQGYRFVEFPIYSFLHAFLFKSIGLLSFEQWGRLINILVSIVTSFVVFSLLKKYISEFAAYSGLIAYLFLPFSIFYSRVILPDVMMTTSIMLGIYFFDKWNENSKLKTQNSKPKVKNKKYLIFNISYFVLSVLFTAMALLLKPFAVFFVFPFMYLAYNRFGLKMFIKWQLYIFAIVAVMPFALWRNWIAQFPEGIPASAWLFNGNGIRFRPAFFRWIFFERITKLILGYFGALFLVFSLPYFKSKKILLFLAFALSSLTYLIVIATGNVQHDYYQILIIPTICMFIGIGAAWVYNFLSRKFNKYLGVSIISLVALSAFYFSWIQVRDYFNINDRGMVEAGTRANEILPRDALIIAPYDGSTTLLNISQRRGWPVFQLSIEKLIDKGADYMVIANPTEDDFSGFGAQFEIVDRSDTYLILKLK